MRLVHRIHKGMTHDAQRLNVIRREAQPTRGISPRRARTPILTAVRRFLQSLALDPE